MLSINQALTLPMCLHAQVFEGRLLRADATCLVLKLSRGQHGEILMLSSRQVRSIHPRFAEGTGSGRRPERCSYFEDCGKCAFGAGCRKTHDPRLLSQDAQCAVANGEDMAMRQQLTLHLATIPEGYDEARIRQEFAKYGKIQSVNICHKTSLLMGKGKEHWRFVCCPFVRSIALPLLAEAGPMRAPSPVFCTNVRNGFVTFSCEKQALHAKTSLNESGVSPKPFSPLLRCVSPRGATGPRVADYASPLCYTLIAGLHRARDVCQKHHTQGQHISRTRKALAAASRKRGANAGKQQYCLPGREVSGLHDAGMCPTTSSSSPPPFACCACL